MNMNCTDETEENDGEVKGDETYIQYIQGQ
jgi:hypothetical protein